jgi:putative phosphoribosyl transferase
MEAMVTIAEGSVAAKAVTIPPFGLEGFLAPPAPEHGIVLFAHGSGSGRMSPRNQYVAGELGKHGHGTLLFDLLNEREAADRSNVFDIGLLAERLVIATEWLQARDDTRGLPVGYFGASTGAAAALVASTISETPIAAIVSRGGRADLAGDALGRVTAPTLLIVGGNDREVLALNQRALASLPHEKEIAIVNGATHLFEEPGALETVVDLAQRWFDARLRRRLSR